MGTSYKSSVKRIATIAAVAAISAVSANLAYASSNSLEEDMIPLIAIGPAYLEKVAGYRTLSVNGQEIIIDSQTQMMTRSGPSSDLALSKASKIDSGDYIEVYGEPVDVGLALGTIIVIRDEPYVDGASETYLAAIVGSTGTNGFAYSNGSTIDLTAALYGQAAQGIAEGDIVELYGTNVGNTLLASEANGVGRDISAAYSQLTGIRGSSGLRGLRGSSGIRGLRGSSGIRGLRGSSGIRGMRGSSGIRGLRGSSGIRGMRGSSGIR